MALLSLDDSDLFLLEKTPRLSTACETSGANHSAARRRRVADPLQDGDSTPCNCGISAPRFTQCVCSRDQHTFVGEGEPSGRGVSSQLVVIVDDSITNLKILERLAGSLGARARSFAIPKPRLVFAPTIAPILSYGGGGAQGRGGGLSPGCAICRPASMSR